MASIDIDKIQISTDRQRQEFDEVSLRELADSIKSVGLLQPIVVDKLEDDSFALLVGERRLRAFKLLGKKKIEAKFKKDLTPEEADIIEWEENERRENLTWQERVCFILRFHVARLADNEDWSQEKTGKLLHLSRNAINQACRVASALVERDEQVYACDGAKAAYNVLKRRDQREIDLELSRLTEEIDAGRVEPPSTESILDSMEIEIDDEGNVEAKSPISIEVKKDPSQLEVIQQDFLTWAPEYDGPRFDFIHMDPPYGIDHQRSAQGGTATRETYEDSPHIYFDFLKCLCDNAKLIIAPKAHIMLWFSMNYYHETRVLLRDELGEAFDWQVDVQKFPLIWHKSDGTGMMPDAARQPQRIYETALIISIGDRKLVTAKPNLVSFPAAKRDAEHLSEKPQMMLNSFLEMFVDENTRVLDPCCGSGTAVARSIALGSQYVLGMDISEESVATARLNVKRAHMLESGVVYE